MYHFDGGFGILEWDTVDSDVLDSAPVRVWANSAHPEPAPQSFPPFLVSWFSVYHYEAQPLVEVKVATPARNYLIAALIVGNT